MNSAWLPGLSCGLGGLLLFTLFLWRKCRLQQRELHILRGEKSSREQAQSPKPQIYKQEVILRPRKPYLCRADWMRNTPWWADPTNPPPEKILVPPLRLVSQPIILFSAGRTGSNFIRQCLTPLCATVVQCHSLGMKRSYAESVHDCVITERDPVDAYLSRVRVMTFNGLPEPFIKNINDESYLLSQLVVYKEELEYVQFIKGAYKGRILSLDYEEFFQSYLYIFSQMEEFFNITIPEALRTTIKENSSRKKNLSHQKDLGGFDTSSPVTGLHGHHIWKGHPGYAKELLTTSNYKKIQNLLA